MKLFYLLFFTLFFGASRVQSQESDIQVAFFGGGSTCNLGFKGFQNFVDSYNTDLSSTLTKNLKFNRFGYGWSGGVSTNLKIFHMSIGLSQNRTFTSYAEFGPAQKRAFQFRNYGFDVKAGVRIGKETLGITPYLGISITALNLFSWFEYQDKIRSFASDSYYSGIWTSWRLIGTGGLRAHMSSGNWGIYADLSFMINKNKYLGGGFKESTGSTDGRYFPSYSGQPNIEAITGGLKESYRNTILSLGIVYSIQVPKL